MELPTHDLSAIRRQLEVVTGATGPSNPEALREALAALDAIDPETLPGHLGHYLKNRSYGKALAETTATPQR